MQKYVSNTKKKPLSFLHKITWVNRSMTILNKKLFFLNKTNIFVQLRLFINLHNVIDLLSY